MKRKKITIIIDSHIRFVNGKLEKKDIDISTEKTQRKRHRQEVSE